MAFLLLVIALAGLAGTDAADMCTHWDVEGRQGEDVVYSFTFEEPLTPVKCGWNNVFEEDFQVDIPQVIENGEGDDTITEDKDQVREDKTESEIKGEQDAKEDGTKSDPDAQKDSSGKNLEYFVVNHTLYFNYQHKNYVIAKDYPECVPYLVTDKQPVLTSAYELEDADWMERRNIKELEGTHNWKAGDDTVQLTFTCTQTRGPHDEL